MSLDPHAPAVTVTAAQALEKLRAGNDAYLTAQTNGADVSPDARERTAREGQAPFAIVVGCADSRVIPEAIFSCGIGDLFSIRVAGNVIDAHQLGSIEYAADHLGTRLVLVLGHTRCGAVGAAIAGEADGHVKFIVDEIREAIGDERDDRTACELNVRHSIARIEESLDIRRDEDELGLRVIGGIYDIETGRVEFLA